MDTFLSPRYNSKTRISGLYNASAKIFIWVSYWVDCCYFPVYLVYFSQQHFVFLKFNLYSVAIFKIVNKLMCTISNLEAQNCHKSYLAHEQMNGSKWATHAMGRIIRVLFSPIPNTTICIWITKSRTPTSLLSVSTKHCINWNILKFNVHFKVILHVQVIMILIIETISTRNDKLWFQLSRSLWLEHAKLFLSVHWTSKYFNWDNVSWK